MDDAIALGDLICELAAHLNAARCPIEACAEALLKRCNTQFGFVVDETTGFPNRDGEPMDRGIADRSQSVACSVREGTFKLGARTLPRNVGWRVLRTALVQSLRGNARCTGNVQSLPDSAARLPALCQKPRSSSVLPRVKLGHLL
jgi:hypothetical protein